MGNGPLPLVRGGDIHATRESPCRTRHGCITFKNLFYSLASNVTFDAYVAYITFNAYVLDWEVYMLALLDQRKEPFVASEAEAAIAKAAVSKLKQVAAAEKDISIVVQEFPNVLVPLPARAVKLIVWILEAMSYREPFSIIPHEAQLTTQQAADYLNVSRPYLTGLLDRGELEHRMVGRHRRIRFADLLEFERKSREARSAAIAKMAAEAERLGLE